LCSFNAALLKLRPLGLLLVASSASPERGEYSSEIGPCLKNSAFGLARKAGGYYYGQSICCGSKLDLILGCRAAVIAAMPGWAKIEEGLTGSAIRIGVGRS
jgi:hypothetical protein